jgi:hypothetical protein
VPAPWHGVAGVHDEVQDNSLDLPGIGLDLRECGSQLGLQHDVLGDQTVQHFSEVADHGAEVQDLHLQDLAAAKSEQLPSQP